MHKIINAVPGYRVYEYLLVLNPHEELRDRVLQVKQQFATAYKVGGMAYGKPNLPVARFTQYQVMEERLVNRLKNIAMGFHPIKVELKDYGSLPTHSIYINMTSKVPVQALVKQVRTGAQHLMKLNRETAPFFIMEPQITIARRLQPWQYEQAWGVYSRKHFSGRFIADAMLLLKRPVGELQYVIAQRFEFQNLPVSITQGELFTG